MTIRPIAEYGIKVPCVGVNYEKLESSNQLLDSFFFNDSALVGATVQASL